MDARTGVPTLILAHIGVSLLGSIDWFPTYNIPILLFGLWAISHHEVGDAATNLRQFNVLLVASALLDILWLILNWSDSGGWAKWMAILSLFGKPYTYYQSTRALQSQGITLGFDMLGGSAAHRPLGTAEAVPSNQPLSQSS